MASAGVFAAITAATTAAATIVQAVGARRQAEAQSQAATYNAKVAEQNADAVRQQAQVQAQQIDRRNRLRIGAVKAAAGGAGIELQGSVIDLIGDMTTQGELERQNALWQGEMQARGFNIDSALSKSQARNARRAGRLRVAGTLLSGASQIGGQVASFKLRGGEA